MRAISRPVIYALAVSAAGLLIPCSYAAAPQFLLTPIPLLPQSTASLPTSVNDNGQVVGTGAVPSGQPVFFWDNGTLTALGPTGPVSPLINNAGQVDGWLQTILPGGDANYNAYLFSNGTTTIIPAIGAGPQPIALDNELSRSYAFNDAGQIAGSAYDLATGNTDPIFWANGATTVILPSIDPSSTFEGGVATHMNADGAVIGSYSVLNQGSTTNYSFFWKNGVLTTFTPAQGFTFDINSQDHVLGGVGSSAWIWNAGTFTFLPQVTTPSGPVSGQPIKMNDNDWVIGYAGAIGVLWHNGTAFPITSSDPNFIAKTIMPTAINAAGQIIGIADKVSSTNQNLGDRGFFYDNGVTAFFEAPTGTTGNGETTADILTQNGDVFGTYNGNQAFFWDAADGLIPLDNLIAGGLDHSLWNHLISVTAISDNNEWITGTGMTNTGTIEGFRLQLVPEPATLSLLALAAVPFLTGKNRNH